ncbi:nuclear transport factor 2 family protein [Streptomyces himalayensis]|uniref:Nuclear transport factor 2 family protein n=1 Tax=Streptomyces himalayensis subsp. himalayensis TaxID=2756131 RepID=A0A7W0I772_9ACTN|nr:nuclear transport factor 2 family protein [Streptomyces himalayensis]MBA2945005.1 nuclear transport factor 2 family protein [Streptomyces himalayensis subsp. himalayensis]
MTGPRTDVEQVERANTAFYEAMERGDFDELSALWLTASDTEDGPGASVTADELDETDITDGEDMADAVVSARPEISCVHPGWPVLTGRGEVLRSYALIMANTEYIQFFLTDVHVSVSGDTALVTCTENILSGAPAPDGGPEPGPLVGQLVVATNVFRRTSAGWKLWSHHASPVLAESNGDEDDETPA